MKLSMCRSPSPTKIAITLVSYGGTQYGAKPAKCNGRDDISITISQCIMPDGRACNPKRVSGDYSSVPSATKKSNTIATFQSSTIGAGVPVCNISLWFPTGTSFGSTTTLVFSFNDVQFYTSHVLYSVGTLNNNDTDDATKTPVWGNGNIGDILAAPQPNDVIRNNGEVNIVSTVNYVENCYSLGIATDNDVSWIQTTTNNCTFDRRSLKEFSTASKQQLGIGNTDFYSTQGNAVYKFTMNVVKGPYWKHVQMSLYVNIGQIIVWIILFALGLVGIFQITREFFALVVPPFLRFRTKHSGYPLDPNVEEQGYREKDKPLELNELKVNNAETPKPEEKKPENK